MRDKMSCRVKTGAMLALFLLLLMPLIRADGHGGAYADGGGETGETGKISGQVVNGTTGEPQNVGAVTLYAFGADGTPVGASEGSTDEEGRFAFEGLDTALTYMPEAEYAGVFYTTESPLFFGQGVSGLETVLKVYETTPDDSEVVINRLHTIITFGEEGVLSVGQMYLFGNHGDRTYVGEGGVGVKISLPEGAEEVAFQRGSTGEDGRTVTDAEPVRPGEGTSAVLLGYSLAFDGDSLSFGVPVAYPVEAANVLVSNRGVVLEDGMFGLEGVREAEGEEFLNYAGEVGRGEVMEFTLSGLSGVSAPVEVTTAPASVRLDQNRLRWGLLVLGLIAIVVAASYPYWKVGEEGGNEERDFLALTIAGLDAAFEEGRIEEEKYRSARADYAARLRRVLERGGEAGDRAR